jgi:phenylalanyl-tRNA synthetase beta chain
MKFSLAWLRDHLEGAVAAEEMARRLTSVGFNVEVREAQGEDEVWDVEVTTNRPDAMNHRGLAREAATAGCGTLRPLATQLAEGAVAIGELARLTVEDPEGCPRYCARVIRGVTVRPSPPWLAERLERCGIRAVNNVVDATNYVLLDVGQPLHAFDLARLAGPAIHVRRAHGGEQITTLDGIVRTLHGDDVVICDARRAVAIAGVMGGAESEIRPTTTDVLIESAYFDPLAVRRTVRRLGLKTEASHRFERGADRAMARTALDRVAALILELAGGEVAAGVLDSAPELPPARRIAFSLQRLSAFAGCPIPEEFVLRVLSALELEPQREGDTITCRVPSHRVDLELPEDLYEEVLRHWGYDAVPAVLPPSSGGPGLRLGSWPVTDRAREALLAAGVAEAITYAFVPAEWDAATGGSPLASRGGAVAVENPLSARMALLRRSLLGGLVDAAAANLRRGATRVRLGEVGRVFFATDSGVREEERLAVVLAGNTGAWDETRAVDFFDIKGLVEGVFGEFAVRDALWEPAATPLLAPGAGAVVRCGEGVVAVAGRLADEAAAALDAPPGVWVAEFDLGAASPSIAPVFRPLPRFPAVVADLTVRHSLDLSWGELVAAVRACAPPWLEDVAPVVRYRGEGVGRHEVKTTLRLTYRHEERSLTQEEVNAAHFALMKALAERLPVSFT